MKKGLFRIGILAFSFFCSTTSIAQSAEKELKGTSTNSTGALTLESIFKDPSLYPKQGNFGEFAPDGKHFI